MEAEAMSYKKLVISGIALMPGLFMVTVQAFPMLNLTPDISDIELASINVDYMGNNSGGTLTASGLAQLLTPPGSPVGKISNGSFDINADIESIAQTATGSIDIGGTVLGLGLNSGTLLTGTFLSTAGNPMFGAGADDRLEFLFDITGGDAAALYGGVGSTAGHILSQSGYSGSFAGNWSSAPFAGLADTFGKGVPENVLALALLALFGLALAGLGWSRRKKA